MHYRITKFDPRKRNQEGHYLDDSEWTSISDIGKIEYGNISYDEYEKTEMAYTKAIKLILDEKSIDTLMVHSLSLHCTKADYAKFKKDGRLKNIEVDFNNDITKLTNGTLLNMSEIEKTIRLILRETIWMNLLYDGIKIIFGYDYYMYVECTELDEKTISKIEEMGLFVEPNLMQKIIVTTDDDCAEI